MEERNDHKQSKGRSDEQRSTVGDETGRVSIEVDIRESR